MSQRGDSGMNQMKDNWSRDGTIWTIEGICHAKLSFRAKVPSVVPAAIMAPAYQDYTLN